PLTRIFAPGRRAASTTTTERDGFRRRAKIAVASPAAPAPTIATSHDSGSDWPDARVKGRPASFHNSAGSVESYATARGRPASGVGGDARISVRCSRPLPLQRERPEVGREAADERIERLVRGGGCCDPFDFRHVDDRVVFEQLQAVDAERRIGGR